MWAVPVISYSCTAPDLSDKLRYPTFIRTSGSNADVAVVIEQLLRHFRWQRLGIVSVSCSIWATTVGVVQVWCGCMRRNLISGHVCLLSCPPLSVVH